MGEIIQVLGSALVELLQALLIFTHPDMPPAIALHSMCLSSQVSTKIHTVPEYSMAYFPIEICIIVHCITTASERHGTVILQLS